MWKTVSMRIRSATAELEEAGEDTDGMVTSTADLQKMVKSMTGYDILEEDGKTFKSIYDIVLNIAKVWDSLSDVNQSALLQALAGKQQSNSLAAALSSPDILEKSYREAMNSEGSAMREEAKYQQSIQYSIDTAKASLEALSNDFIDHNFLKDIIEFGDGAINVLDQIVVLAGQIGTLGGNLSSGSGSTFGLLAGLATTLTGHGKLYCAPFYKIGTVIFPINVASADLSCSA